MAATNKELLIKIDRYLMNRMKGQELRDFEIQVSLDPELKKELEFERLVNESIRYYRKQQLKKYLYENATTKLMGNVWGRSWTRVSAIIIVVMGLIILWLKYSREERVQGGQDIYVAPQMQERPVEVPSAVPDTVVEPQQPVPDDPLPDEDIEEQEEGEEEAEVIEETGDDRSASDDWEEMNERHFAGDSIKVDYKILDTLVFVYKLDSMPISDSALAMIDVDREKEVSAITPVGKMHVELWQSPVNFRGYRLQDQHLQLYGIIGLQDKRFFYHNGLLYMETENDLYALKESRSFNQLRPVRIIKEKE